MSGLDWMLGGWGIMGFSSGVSVVLYCRIERTDMQIQIKQSIAMDMKNESNEIFGKTGKASSLDNSPIFVILCLQGKWLCDVLCCAALLLL